MSALGTWQGAEGLKNEIQEEFRDKRCTTFLKNVKSTFCSANSELQNKKKSSKNIEYA